MAATDSLELFSFPSGPDYSHEVRLKNAGKNVVAGTDEAGRGPLAGPVVAAAVVLDPANIPPGLDDSKKLGSKQRLILFDQITRSADCSWASLPAVEIDRLNIRQASLSAMTIAIHGLAVQPDAVLVDGKDVPEKLTGLGTALVKGDSRSLSIAAASIVAKVVRDRIMEQAATAYPVYGFEKHKGYGSRAHLDAILTHGPCRLHRRSFAPMRNMAGEPGSP